MSQAEWGIVSRTEGILKQQDAELAARLGEAEARRGVEGFGQTQDELEKVSPSKKNTSPPTENPRKNCNKFS